ncbi:MULTISPECIES: nuclease-related domain-containing protein [Nocardia]|uniref:nuclease-related domain-containing protein n=1 Tax=Nocardia TaxID=1817 RepID=UPI000D6879E7|nr:MULTISPECIES: nuclease-related domain-containing protein [Nocardia]
MLVIEATPAGSYSETRVRGWLSSSTADEYVAGVAIAGCHIADPSTGRSQQVDVLVLMPRAIIAVEVKGLHPDIRTGTIIAESNGPWSHDQSDLDPVHTLASAANPVNQTLSAALKTKHAALEHNPGRPFVEAVVALVAPQWSAVTLRAGVMPDGFEVVLGESALRAALSAHASKGVPWTAEQAFSLINSLNLGRSVTISQLIAEGFPSGPSQPTPPRPRTVPWPPPRRSTFGAHRSRPAAGVREVRSGPHRDFSHRSRRTPRWTPSRLRYRKRPRRHHLQQVLAVVTIVAVVSVVWWLVVHFSATSAPTPTPNAPTPTSVLNPVPGTDHAAR